MRVDNLVILIFFFFFMYPKLIQNQINTAHCSESPLFVFVCFRNPPGFNLKFKLKSKNNTDFVPCPANINQLVCDFNVYLFCTWLFVFIMGRALNITFNPIHRHYLVTQNKNGCLMSII